MGLLNRATRTQLLAALESILVLDTPQGRTLLLVDLPPALVNTIHRDDTKVIDLTNIVSACDAWSIDALRVMIENARNLVVGSTVVTQLQTVLDALNTASTLALASSPGSTVPPSALTSLPQPSISSAPAAAQASASQGGLPRRPIRWGA